MENNWLDNLNSEYDIGKAFEAIESELISSMMRNLQRHKVEEIEEEKQWEMWQALQLKALEKYKKENKKKFSAAFPKINEAIESIIRQAKELGGMEQENAILKAIQKGESLDRKNVGDGLYADFFRVNERKLGSLIDATTNDMDKAETAVLRRANDQYRKIIFNAQAYANTGAGTYEKAVDMATKDFLARGIDCIEYKNGARHNISDYAKMAIRTASKRAYLQGEGNKRKEWEHSLVIVNKRGNACPKCAPFCGKIFIDDVWSGGKKSDGSYPLLSTAIKAGLYHPNCKDSHTTYFPKTSKKPETTFTKKELEKIEDDYNKEQRKQYAKRQEERFGRLAKYSLDEENQEGYKEKANEWGITRKSYKYPINEGVFTTLARPRDDGKNIDVQRPHNIIKVLTSNQVGRAAYRHVNENKIPINMLYNMDNPKGVSGEYDPGEREIYIYVDKTKTIRESAKTIVHEATHDRLGHTGTRREEVLCFLEEAKFEGIALTQDVIRSIIKEIREVGTYKDLPWR